MNKSILLLRLSYWIAAIADFIVAILVWIPGSMGVAEIAYPMGLASVTVFSWTVMLLIADRKPIERKWILIPTILVVTLITIVRTKFSLDGTIEFNLVLLLFAIALISFMTYSYYYASKHASSR
jgi:drug/metabolite transporter (DMT)-like permease